ncbi:CBS domain-containing protein [Kineothrix sedimenti]|uniref:CBS domain-containing protein n=1 Tax=Kineothrix sedimenti TaxID=3123317 RepID=A0ABZ3F0H1_9FIRM
MNILFFLTPKKEVAYIYDDDTLRQTLEKMEHHRYTAIPVIDHMNGKYIGTITEGDLLWDMKERYDLTLKEAEDVPIHSIKRKRDNEPVEADADIEDLISKVMNQNFVPVIDGSQCFIGIITRKDVIQYLTEKCGLNK